MNSENKTESVPNDTTITTVQPSAKNVCCGIYGLRNKANGKWYVGQSVDVMDRWKGYSNLKCKNQRKLQYALKKYGYESFEKVVIEECDNVDWILDYREMYWIRLLDSVKNGYNLTYGGRSGERSAEARRKLRDKMRTPETRENCRRAALNRSDSAKKRARDAVQTQEHRDKQRRLSTGRKMPLDAVERSRLAKIGKPRSEETKMKLRLAQLGRKMSAEAIEKNRLKHVGMKYRKRPDSVVQ